MRTLSTSADMLSDWLDPHYLLTLSQSEPDKPISGAVVTTGTLEERLDLSTSLETAVCSPPAVLHAWTGTPALGSREGLPRQI